MTWESGVLGAPQSPSSAFTLDPDCGRHTSGDLLRKLGFASGDMERHSGLAALERESRHAKFEKAAAEVVRLQHMGELLWNGGFTTEAQTPLRKAVALMAAAVRFAFGIAESEGDIMPLSPSDMTLAQGELDMQPVDAETLDFAARGADMPNPVERVRHFIDECRLMV